MPAGADRLRSQAGSETTAELSSAEVFEQFHDRIHRYVLSMVRDPAEADDVTQETFLRAHRQLTSLQDPGALGAWLYRIATRLCYDRSRTRSRRPPPDSLDLGHPGEANSTWSDADGPGLAEAIERAEMSECVQDFLDVLPHDYRTVVILHDLEGVMVAEIAQMLGVSLDAAKIRLHRARRRLAASLEAGCDFAHDERGTLVCEKTSTPREPQT